MKICWDNLNGFYLNSKGILSKKGRPYKEVGPCKFCGNMYLVRSDYTAEYCSLSCVRKANSKGVNNNFYGKTHTKETKVRMSVAKKGDKAPFYGKSLSVSVRKKIGIANSKGNVCKLDLPLYDTYAHQIDFAEEVRLHIDKDNRRLLEVRCSKCGKWFVPKAKKVQSRITSLKGQKRGECRLYCSSHCKDSCEVFGKNPNHYLTIGKSKNINCFYTPQELIIWSKEVLKRTNHKCEICGKKAEHAHHIQPKKLEPGLALDPENGLAICKKCHYKYGHRDECSSGRLSIINCKGEEPWIYQVKGFPILGD